MPNSDRSHLQIGDVLWTPSPERIADANITRFMKWLEREKGLRFDSYAALWQWSVDELEDFWQAIWEYFEIKSSAPHECVLRRRVMPGADWFPGARLNFAEHMLLREQSGKDALLHLSETQAPRAMKWDELAGEVRILATELRRMGVKPGDRVVAYLPNTPHALIAMLAAVSIGAIWASCGPDFGIRGALDRYSQLEPTVIFCVDGYRYGGKSFSRKAELKEILQQLPTLQHVIYLPYLNPQDGELPCANAILWNTLLGKPAVPASQFRFEQVPFSHPLMILFSSGTTGLPKPIVHCHGGTLLEQLKSDHLHMDLHPGDKIFFFTTTGWMMWNFLTGSILVGAIPVLYDGNPAYPEADVLWKMVEQTGTSFFGASPTYQQILAKSGIVPKDRFDLSRLKSVMLAGSPVTAECMAWFYDNVKSDIFIMSGSGGTDVCTGFNGGVPSVSVYAGEIQGPHLGVAAYAFNEHGERIVDEVGELVITEPMPSMPVGFWGDHNNERFLESYFQDYPGIWRHGDFYKVNRRGGCFVLGRSDATLNRHGVRIGTAEIYRSLQKIVEVEDSLIVNLDLPGGNFFMPLFVKLQPSLTLDASVEERIKKCIRDEYSPRHVPDKIYQVAEIPYTLTGKKMEIPVRRIMTGIPLSKAANTAAMANPSSLEYFVAYTRHQQDYRL
jgi:acetoacetyl-CoA synthetase